MSAAWSDPAEGPYLRLLAGLMVLVGIVLFAEGMKRDIIEAIREAVRQKPSAGESVKVDIYR